MIKLPKVLPAPKVPDNLQENVLWLSGEGAGSWFVIEQTNNSFEYMINRYSPDGKFECGGVYTTNDLFNIVNDFEITYPSNCAKVTLIQNKNKVTFNYKHN